MLILLSVLVVICSLSWSFAWCLVLQTSSRRSQFKTPKYCQNFKPRTIWCFHGAVHVTRDNEGCYRSLDLCGAQSQCMLGSITYVAQTKSCTKNSLCGFLSLVIPPYVKDKVSNRSAVLLGAASNSTIQINEKVVPLPFDETSVKEKKKQHWRYPPYFFPRNVGQKCLKTLVFHQITRKSGHRCASPTWITWISCITCTTCSTKISHQLISWYIINYHWFPLFFIGHHW